MYASCRVCMYVFIRQTSSLSPPPPSPSLVRIFWTDIQETHYIVISQLSIHLSFLNYADGYFALLVCANPSRFCMWTITRLPPIYLHTRMSRGVNKSCYASHVISVWKQLELPIQYMRKNRLRTYLEKITNFDFD